MVCLTVFSLSAQNKSIILGRPTNTSITASVLFDQAVQFYLEYGVQPGVYTGTTATISNTANVPNEVDMQGLLPDTPYFYRLRHRTSAAGAFAASPEYRFRTQRAPGSSFRFVVEADEHLYDKKGVRSLYQIALHNQALDSADFMLSLGDTFGDDHTPDETTSADMDLLHKDYLQYLGAVCHSMPFYFCLGNHEGESGYWLNQNPPENIGVYGTQWRKFYYPNPYPNDFYSGNMIEEPYGIGQPENYYAWTWGDALFVVLDVYRDCAVNEKPQKWDWTLGETQYNWLKNSLETSSAKYKFVFAHHTRGQGRGGVETASGFEWGGYDNNQWKFDTYRPGWAMPIHQLMVTNGVNIFFQGHDHLFAKEELDGLVYQETPMPSDTTYEIGILANADAYTDVTLDGSGHLRVNVTPTCVTVDYVRAYLPADTLSGEHHNREVAYSYSVGECAVPTQESPLKGGAAFSIMPNPAKEKLEIKAQASVAHNRRIELLNVYGQIVLSKVLEQGAESCLIAIPEVPSGIYAVRMEGTTRKVIINR